MLMFHSIKKKKYNVSFFNKEKIVTRGYCISGIQCFGMRCYRKIWIIGHSASHHPIIDFFFSPYISMPCCVLFLTYLQTIFSHLLSDQECVWTLTVFTAKMHHLVMSSCRLALQSESLPLKKKASPRIWATASKWLVHLSGASRAGLRDGEKRQKKRKNKWGRKKKKNHQRRSSLPDDSEEYTAVLSIDLSYYKQSLGV